MGSWGIQHPTPKVPTYGGLSLARQSPGGACTNPLEDRHLGDLSDTFHIQS